MNELRIEKEKNIALQTLRANRYDPALVEKTFDRFSQRLTQILEEHNAHYQEVEQDLIRSERALCQIIQGSTIPTFVIDQDHRVTHWNKACEKLTGYSAEQIVGTNDQWRPFRSEKRPVMADLILDGVSEDEVWRYYGTKWSKSALINGAYEAEEYFPHLGDNGKWLYFTAAPIKTTDGAVIGAIETLWDKTADKKAQEEQKAI
jgi:PAS domain S-box-containing protein